MIESSVNPVCEGEGKTLMLVGQGGVDGAAKLAPDFWASVSSPSIGFIS